MERIKKNRKGLSIFTLIFFVSMLLFESGVFAMVDTSLEALSPFSFTYSKSEVMKGEELGISVNVNGVPEDVQYMMVSYRSLVNEKYLMDAYIYENAEAEFNVNRSINGEEVPGAYAIDKVSYMTSAGYFTIYNEKYYVEEENKAIFSDSEFSIVGTYGGIKPIYELNIPKKELTPQDQLVIEMNVDSSMFDFEFSSIELTYNVNYNNKSLTLEMTEPGKFRYEGQINSYDREGLYQLQQMKFNASGTSIIVYDLDYSYVLLVNDLSSGDFSISGTSLDDEGPVLNGISFSEHILTPERSEKVYVDAQDNQSGVAGGELRFIQLDANGSYKDEINVQLALEENQLVGTAEVNQYLSSGHYALTSVNIFDHAGNYKNYTYENDPSIIDHENHYLDVYGTLNNYQPVQSLSLSSNEATPDKGIQYDMLVDEKYFQYDKARIQYQYNGYQYLNIELVKTEEGHYQGNYQPSFSNYAGEYIIQSIYLEKDLGSESISLTVNNSITNMGYSNEMDLSHGNFIVKDTAGGVIPEITLTTDKSSYTLTDNVKVELDMITKAFNPEEINIGLIHTEDQYASLYVTLRYDEAVEKYVGNIEDIKYKKAGKYDVDNISFSAGGQHFYFTNNKYGQYDNSMEFTDPLIELTDTLGGAPLGINIQADKAIYNEKDTISTSFSFLNESIKPEYVRVELINLEDNSSKIDFYLYYDEVSGTYKGTYQGINQIKPGQYAVNSLYFNDGYYRSFYNSEYTDAENSFELKGSLFEITNVLWGYQPEITISSSIKEAKPGDNVKVTVRVPVDVVDFTSVGIHYVVDGMNPIYKYLTKIGPGVFEFNHQVGAYDRPGAYAIGSINLGGEGYNNTIYDLTSETYFDVQKIDLSGGNYTIKDSILDENPPSLVSVSFPGEALTQTNAKITVEATDDLSGIKSGEVLLIAPAGAYRQYVSLQLVENKLSGEFYLNSENSGLWQVERIYITDQAGNTSNYWNENVIEGSYGTGPINQGPLTMNVQKRILKNVVIEQDKTMYGPKEEVEIGIDILDEDKYSSISLVYLDPLGQELSIYAQRQTDGLFTGQYFVEPYYESGEYILQKIIACTDRYSAEIINGNPSAYGFGELSAGNFTLEGTVPDVEAPTFKDLFFNKSSLIYYEKQIITLISNDDSSGASGGTVTLKHDKSDAVIEFPLYAADDEVLKADYFMDEHIPSGEYTVIKVVLRDKMNNTRTYCDQNLEVTSNEIPYDFSKYSFSVVGNVLDSQAPEFISLQMDKNSYAYNEKVTYTLNYRDNISSGMNIFIQYSNELGQRFTVQHNYLSSPSELIFSKSIADDFYGMSAGSYRADAIILTDNAQNMTIIKRPGAEIYDESESMKEMDLSHLDFVVTEPVTEDSSKYFTSIAFDKEVIRINEMVKITLTPGIELMNANRITLFYDVYGKYVTLTKDTNGNFIGEIEFSQGYEGSKRDLCKVRAIFSGSHMDIGDIRYTNESLLTDLSAGDISVEKNETEIFQPVLKTLSITDGNYTGGDVVPINLLVDNIKEQDTMEVTFRVDGEVSNQWTYLNQGENFYRIGSYDPSGVYTIDQIRIYNNNGTAVMKNILYYPEDVNSVNIDGTFTVSGTQIDYSEPEFKGITVDRKTAAVGEVVTYTIDATDKESGLEYALLYLEAPSGRNGDEPVVLHPNVMGKLQGTFEIKPHHVSGQWKPRMVQLIDNKGNRRYVENSMSASTSSGVNMEAANVEVTTDVKLDIKPPVFYGFTYLNVNGNRLIELDAEDDISGISEIFLSYSSGETRFMVSGEVFKFNGKYYAELPGLKNTTQKPMYLAEVRMFDYAGNEIRYQHGVSKGVEYTLDMSFGTLPLESPEVIRKINNITIDKNIGTRGEEVTVSLTLEEALTGTNNLYGHMSSGIYSHGIYFQQVSEKEYKAVVQIEPHMGNGLYMLNEIVIEGENETYRTLNISTNYDLKYADNYMDLSDIFFNVIDNDLEQTELSIRNIRIIKEESGLAKIFDSIGNLFGVESPAYKPQDLVTIEVEVNESESDLSYINLRYTNKYKIREYNSVHLTKISEGIYRTEIRMDDFIDPGNWNIDMIQIFNNSGQEFYESSYEYDQGNYKLDGFEKLNFSVDNENADYTGPVVESVEVESNQVLRGEPIKYQIKANDNLAGIKSMVLTVKGTFTGKETYIYMEETTDGIFEGELETDTLADDVWRVKLIEMSDYAFNDSNIVNMNYNAYSNYAPINLDGADVELVTVKEIIIKNIPEKQTYYTGEKLDLKGLVVAAVLNDDTERIFLENEYAVSGFDSSKAISGQVISVTYGSMVKTFKVDIVANELVSIGITNLPLKTKYFIGEELNLNGLVVIGKYKEGSQAVLEVTNNNVIGFDSSKAITGQVLTVTINGKSDTFSVDILKKELVEVTLVTPPEKLSYLIGESFDITGLELLGKYSDGSSEKVNAADIKVTGFDSSKAVSAQIVTITIQTWSFSVEVQILNQSSQSVEVLAGANRFRTAIAISKASYEQTDVAVLVQANNFPDALAAGPLAYILDAPILLTSSTSLSASTKEELTRLGVKKVVIMGGESAVSSVVEDTLRNVEGYQVERVNGSNRYGTAVETAKYMDVKIGNRETIVLASGVQFADALAAGSFAAKEGYPILLTDGTRLNGTTMEYVKNSNVKNIILVGGTSVISEGLENELRALGKTVTRQSGKNRFDTSLEIAKNNFSNSDKAIIANGMDFADALAAAPYAARLNAPIILVNQTRISLSIKEYIPGSMINQITVVGGDAAVSSEVKSELQNLIR